MLEYFTIKKLRKNHQPTQPIGPVGSTTPQNEPLTPLLAPQDEHFLTQVISNDQPEPEKVIFQGPQTQTTPVVGDHPVKATTETIPNTTAPVAQKDGTWKETLREKWGYLESFGTVTASRLEDAVSMRKSKSKEQEQEKGKEKAVIAPSEGAQSETPTVASSVADTTPGTATPTTPTGTEFRREDQELTEILDRLDCAASNGTILSSPSASLKPLVAKFTQIFKDLMNGVPTAYDDLISLFDSSNSMLEKTYTSLPTFLKQLIASLPDKMTPEVLRTLAATSPALANVGTMGLKEMVTTPGVLVNLLKSIVQILKTRFPMLLGGSVAAGLGVFVLFIGLWYCYKRGREVREESEERERMEEFGVEKIKTEKELADEKIQKEKAEKQKAREERSEAGPAKRRWWHSK